MTAIDWKKEREEAEAIRKENATHQIATFGHVLTQDELDADEAKWKEERRKKFEGLSDLEIAALLDRETKEWKEKMIEKYDYEDEYEEGLSEEELERRMERNKLAYAKAFHDAAEEGKARREARKQSQAV
jgi:hypothetical protein